MLYMPTKQLPSGMVLLDGSVVAPGAISVYTDFTILANGAVPTSHQGLQLPLRTYYPPSAGSVPLVVRDGRLQSESENSGLTVCYTETDMRDQVSGIGADVSFKSNSGGAGTCALCVWGDSSLVDTFALGRIPVTGCHFIIQRSFWAYQIWDYNGAGTQLITLKSGTVPNIPQDQSTFRVEIVFDGDSAIVSFPEYGFSQRVIDSRIRTLGRRYACWETYQSASTIDKPQFARIWASSARQAEMASSAAVPTNQVHAVQSATNGNKTITEVSETPASEIDSSTFVEFVFPASGKVLLEYNALINQTVAGTVLMDMALVDAGGGNLSYIPCQISNAVGRAIPAQAVYSNPALAGARRFFRPRAWVLSGAAATISRSVAGGLNPVLKVTELA